MLENEREIRLAAAIVAALRPLRLTWLEAAVLHHHYWYALDLMKVAQITERNPREIVAARQTLVTKAAAALGFIEAPKEIGPITVELPMSPEERARKAEELRKQGLTWPEIERRLGVTYSALWRYNKRHGRPTPKEALENGDGNIQG